MNKAAFLDRDGTINRKLPEGQYVTQWEQLEILPKVTKAIELLNRAGFLVIVISNQRCVAKGLVLEEELKAIHRRMCSQLAAEGARIDDVYYCPHEKQARCSCRKPAPGMLLEAASSHEIDLSRSWMIGDSEVDVLAGRNAGCRTAHLLTNGFDTSHSTDVSGSSLLEVVEKLLTWNPVATGPHSDESFCEEVA